MSAIRRTGFWQAALLLAAGSVHGTTLFSVGDAESRVGEGALSFGLHSSRGEGTFSAGGQPFAAGDVDTRAAVLGVSYRFAERWTVEARLPWVRRRNQGFLSHDPALLQPPRPNLQPIDDGRWHGGLQDLSATFRYDAYSDGMLVRPFVGVSIPTRSYPFFGNSAIGTRLHKGQLGVEMVRPIGLSNFYWRAVRLRSDRTLVRERQHPCHRGELELGWIPADRLRLRVFVSERAGKGLPADADFGARTNLRWYHHDQNVEHSFRLAGLGAEYALGQRWSLSAVALRLVEGRSIHRIRFASTLELAWHFGPVHRD